MNENKWHWSFYAYRGDDGFPKLKGIPLLIMCLWLITSLSMHAQTFEIRGVLPWHNFLSGPTAWNEDDYRDYLDSCHKAGINFIAFHNYSGGGERYVNYVEPLIKIQYKNILPDAFLDNSGTSRWGYLPMKVRDFPFGSDKLFELPSGTEYFGADCSITAKTKEENYEKTQNLMREVLIMAHERNIQMAMGFEFGVAPPEYASVHTNQDMYWMGSGSLIYNPFDPDASGILYATIDNIISAYPGIDWIYLWLNEHCMYGVDPATALKNPLMADYFNKFSTNYISESGNQTAAFLGVWAQAFIQKAYDYIKMKSPDTKIVIGGWGGEYQMALLLKGLDKTLPRDITFSMLNPNLGQNSHPDFFREISKNRNVWAIPWLEGDNSLWHIQPRVEDMKNNVKKAYLDSLKGVIAIHWRTREIKDNFKTFTYFANNPESELTTLELYKQYCNNDYGELAGQILAPLLAGQDMKGTFKGLISEEYYAYNPTWGRLTNEQMNVCSAILDTAIRCLKNEQNDQKIRNLKWFIANYKFMLLLNDVSKKIQPAWDIRSRKLIMGNEYNPSGDEINAAYTALHEAPIKEMIEVFVSKVSSRGELGELSSINQRVWGEYLLLSGFMQKMKENQ